MNIKYISPYLLILIEFSILPILYLDVLLANLLNKKYIKNAKLKLANYKGVKICITGSYGKTSTKSVFNQMLNIYYNSVSAKKSYNTELGVSKFVNSIDIDLYDYLVLEYASAKKNDISKLCNIGMPDVAVVTEVGYMHLDTFKNINTILDEKMSIIKDARIVILNYDNEYIREYKIEDRIVLSYGFNYGIYNAKNIKNGSFDFYYRDVFVMHFDTKLIGRHQILNLLCVLAYAHYMNFNLDKLVNALKLFKLESNRLEIKNINNNIIIDDSFNSNINGFIEALRILGNYNKKRILLTPGLVELGKYEKEIYNNLSNHIINNCDIVILVGYNECRYLYYLIKSYNLEIYVVRDFKEGYKLYLELIKDYKDAVLLIENDLPDIYIKRFIF